MSAAEIGMLSAIVVVTKIAASPSWAWLADHLRRRVKVIQITSLLSFLSFGLVFLSEQFWPLFIVLLIFSLFWGAGLPLIEATTLSYLGDNSHSYTVIRIWGSISFIICVLCLGYLFDYIPIRHLLPILLILMLLVWIESLTIPEIRIEAHYNDALSFYSIVRRKLVVILFLVCFLMQASHGSYYTFFSIYLSEHGYSSRFIGFVWSLGVLAEVIIYLFTHQFIRQSGLQVLMVISVLLASLRWLLIAFYVDNVLILLLAQCLHAATFGIYHAVAIQYIHREFKGAHQGRGQALYSSISFGAGMAVGSLLSGYLWDLIGSSNTFIVSALISALAMLLVVYGLREKCDN